MSWLLSPQCVSVTSITMTDFLECEELFLNLKFNTFYLQVFGTAMGSPISPTVANLVMVELENEVV